MLINKTVVAQAVQTPLFT